MGSTRRQGADVRADDKPRGVTGAGTDNAAFPVGVLVGAAIGGVGGALPGNETAASADAGRRADRPDDAGRGAADGER